MIHLGYERQISKFLTDDENYILGKIISDYQHEVNDLNKRAWISQINILKNQLSKIKDGKILFEYKIPRMSSEIDNVLLIDGIVFILEFKVGGTNYSEGFEQLDNYAHILKNFHLESRGKLIVPILVSTEARSENNTFEIEDNLMNIIKSNKENLSTLISKICDDNKNDDDLSNWSKSKYSPTPSILEAARLLYKNHDVNELDEYAASDYFLNETENTINEIIDFSKNHDKKSIIFITGIPGAGKTLIGLNNATKRNIAGDEPAVFLSGTGPLIRVLQEALARDTVEKNKKEREEDKTIEKITKKEADRRVASFIQAVHHFRDEAVKNDDALYEKIVIFDESQRAWTKHETEKYMKNKKKIENFGMSEPEFLISVMDRHQDWAVIICLVGQGQEINKGEAGINEWFKALENSFPHWDIYASIKSFKGDEQFNNLKINDKDHLYLYTTMRSLNAPNLPNFIEFLLNNNKSNAKHILNEFNDNYEIYITRNLAHAKKWVKQKFNENPIRYGLLAQSNAIRLIPEGIFVKNNIDEKIWFLNEPDDVRSSNFLEITATEFDVQGLEIDYSIVAWDANLRYIDNKFEYYKFHGTKWNNIKDENETDKNYLINSYRVLLTRARQGMVIFVPEGDDEDTTRLSKYYDGTYEYLKSIGIKELKLENNE